MFWFRLKELLSHFISIPERLPLLIFVIWLGVGGIVWLLGSGRRSWLEALKNNDGAVVGLHVDPGKFPPAVFAQLPAPDDNTPLCDAAKIKTLAERYELYQSYETNPHLCFDDRAAVYWSKQGWPAWVLELKFLSRRLVLEAAERDRARIPSQSDLSKWAERVYPILLKRAQEK